MKIGFIGLGIMGSRMAANLQKNGYSLTVFNRTRAKAEPLLGPAEHFLIPRQTRRTSGRLVYDAGQSGRGRTSSSGRQWIFGSPPAKCTLGRL